MLQNDFKFEMQFLLNLLINEIPIIRLNFIYYFIDFLILFLINYLKCIFITVIFLFILSCFNYWLTNELFIITIFFIITIQISY